MRDFDGADSAGIERIRERFARVCGLYGYGLVDPSPLESLSTLETRSGPAIRDEIYHFEDKGGRRVALRFDFTMGLARRAAQQRSERLPSKVASFGGVFRYDEPQQGRYRYFHQWDMEVFGNPSADADAEIIEATALLFESLGMKGGISIRVCHRGLVESLVRSVFGPETSAGEMADILRAMDKAAKKPRDVIISEYAGAAGGGGGNTDRAAMLGELLEYAGMRGSADEIAGRRGEVSSLHGWDGLASLYDSLGSRGVDCAVIDLGIVRGLDYYSGMVFEVFDASDDDDDDGGSGGGPPARFGSLAGGGRYDALMKAFGRPDLGAAGVAGGVERTMLAMRRRGLLDGDDDNGDGAAGAGAPGVVAVICATPDARRVATGIASALRRGGITTEFDIAGRPLKKQMASASRAGARTAVIIGTEEVQNRQALLRMMDTGEQRTVKLEELAGDPGPVIARVSQERPS